MAVGALAGAVALVTGASGGLGKHLSHLLAAEGVEVVLGYSTGKDRAEALAKDISAAGGRAHVVQLDLTEPDSVQRAVDAVVEHCAAFDLLVNNAGIASGGYSLPAGDLEALTPEIWDALMAVNLRGPYLVTRAAASHLRASRWGRVVNLGSTIGEGPWGAGAAYAPSKGAVVSLTRFLAAALAPDVTVNCVAPGLMEGTKMSGGAPEDFVAGWRGAAVLNRTTGLEDVAHHVLAYLKSASTTGQLTVVDGGIHFH